MPKRKSDDYDRIKRKIRKLEKKLRRKRHRSRSQYNSDDSESSFASRSPHRDRRRSPDNYRDNDFMEISDDEQVMLDLESPSPKSQTDIDRTEPEPNPIPSTSSVENCVSIPSVVVAVHRQRINVDRPAQSTIPAAPAPPADPAPSAEPATSAELAPSADLASIPVTEDLELNSELLDILGSDPTTEKKYGKDIQKDLSVRFQHWTTTGLTKEQKKELKEKYLTPENAKLIDPPELNAEIKAAAVSDIVVKRDKAIEGKQRQLTLAITSLGEAITLILSAKEKNTALLKILMDSAKIICDCQHADTITRRNFLLNTLKKEVREQLQNTKIDKLLFGENLAETLKSAKAINKSGTDLKLPATKLPNKKPPQSTASSSRNLNWKNPGPLRRQTGPPRTKEPATTSMRSRPANSSKQSQYQQQQRQGYNRRR